MSVTVVTAGIGIAQSAASQAHAAKQQILGWAHPKQLLRSHAQGPTGNTDRFTDFDICNGSNGLLPAFRGSGE